MKFKTPRQAKEFPEITDRLKSLVYLAKHYMLSKYNYEITITDVLRTQEEQDSIYGDNTNYIEKPWKSVHQYFRGVDIRSKDMTGPMINDLRDLLNTIPYDENRPNKKTCIVKDVGRGLHFHIQANK